VLISGSFSSLGLVERAKAYSADDVKHELGL